LGVAFGCLGRRTVKDKRMGVKISLVTERKETSCAKQRNRQVKTRAQGVWGTAERLTVEGRKGGGSVNEGHKGARKGGRR